MPTISPIFPIAASVMLFSKLVPGSILKIYQDGAHGLGDTNKDQRNEDLLEFLKS